MGHTTMMSNDEPRKHRKFTAAYALIATVLGCGGPPTKQRPPHLAGKQEPTSTMDESMFFTEKAHPFTGEPMRLLDWDRVYAGVPAEEHPAPTWAGTDALPGWELLPSSDVSNTRIGGAPTLAAEQTWPEQDGTPLIFIAQVDFGELTRSAGPLPAPMPSSGVLSLFGPESPPFEGSANAEYRLLYTEAATAERLSDVPAWPLRYLQGKPTLVEVVEGTAEDEARPHVVGGRPRWVQFGPSLEKVHLASRTYREGARIALEKASVDPAKASPEEVVRRLVRAGIHPRDVFAGSRDWTVLWQIPSTDKTGFEFYDGGTLYVLIRPSDLAARKFDRAWLYLECF